MNVASFVVIDQRQDGRERIVGTFSDARTAEAACAALRSAGDGTAHVEQHLSAGDDDGEVGHA